MPRVSVIVPVWNRAATIGRAIGSVVAQTPPEGWEVETIVVDDGSTDDLPAALDRFGDSVSIIRHETNRGAAAARNTGVSAATGELVAFLDADDIWLPNKLATHIPAIQQNGWHAGCTAYFLVRRGRAIISPPGATRTLDLNALAWGCYVSPGSTLICRRSVFNEIGPIDVTLRRLEDWDWLLRYAQKYPLGFLAEPLSEIEPSDSANPVAIREAIEAIHRKHYEHMDANTRRHFAAGLDIELAALHYRSGAWSRMLLLLLRSLLRVPSGNRAMATIIHNRLLQSRP